MSLCSIERLKNCKIVRLKYRELQRVKCGFKQLKWLSMLDVAFATLRI
jgi:hypothetical protein